MPRIPKTPKGVAERLAKLALRRLALQDQVNAIQAEERQILEAGLSVFRAKDCARYDLEGVGSVTRTKQPIVDIDDWGKVLDYAARHPDLGVVHKRVSPTAVEKLLMEKKVAVPGVKLDHKEVLTVNVRAARRKK